MPMVQTESCKKWGLTGSEILRGKRSGQSDSGDQHTSMSPLWLPLQVASVEVMAGPGRMSWALGSDPVLSSSFQEACSWLLHHISDQNI